MNHLNIEVSCFANYYTESNPRPVNLLKWLTSDKYASTVRQIRAIDDKDERNRLKGQLPAITTSGTFSRRQQDCLIKHSGLIQFDVDGKDNGHITNFTELKEQVSKLAEVVYCGLSVSGRGFWGLVPIAYPAKHKLHFQALQEDFRRWGIILDSAPANVASLRGYSYDPDGYFNPQAKVYTKLFEPKPQRYRKSYQGRKLETDEARKVEACLQAIEAGRIDITGNYDKWKAIASALANEFGEVGRDYFHRASQFHHKYDQKRTDEEFDKYLKYKYSYDIATFYHYAGLKGITYKESFQKHPKQPRGKVKAVQAKEMPNNEARKPSPQADGLTGAVVLAAMKKLNPALGQLVDVFGLEVESYINGGGYH